MTLEFVHRHNLVRPDAASPEKRFGIKVTLPKGDTFTRLLGDDWTRLHWYASDAERDKAFEKMSIRHGYYRKSDNPTQILEKVTRQAGADNPGVTAAARR